MGKKKLLLRFSQNSVSKPLTYRLTKDFDLSFNIFRARVTPEEKGEMWIEVEGSEERIKQGIKYLENEGVNVSEIEKQIERNREKCTDCGACISLCRAKAITLNPKTYEVEFDNSKCIACELCVDACPVGAIKVNL